MNDTLPIIDGVQAEREEMPCSVAELSDALKRAWDSGTSVIPVGGGSKLHLGNPPRSAGIALRTCRLRGIVEYEPDNMTVSVLAGTPVEELQNVLKAHSQFLPLDPPYPERATIGGIVACNTSGPLRFRYGTIRDLLLGVRIVHAEGAITRAGGKLVKNVSGYDMCKLYTGSLGTLGVFSELTFKVHPKPEALGTALLAYGSFEKVHAAMQQLLRTQLQPDAVEAWNGEASQLVNGPAEPSPWVAMVRVGDLPEAVEWQMGRIEEIASSTGGEVASVLDTEASEDFWARAASAREAATDGEQVLVKCCVLCASAAATARAIEDAGRSMGARTSVFCHAGTNILYGHYRWADAAPDSALLRNSLSDLRTCCASAGGHMVVEKLRPDAKAGFDVWGYDAPALHIMRRIKNQFDSKSLLNPGRFVGGI